MASSDMAWARVDAAHVPPEIDPTKPSVARVYDAILGALLRLLAAGPGERAGAEAEPRARAGTQPGTDRAVLRRPGPSAARTCLPARVASRRAGAAATGPGQHAHAGRRGPQAVADPA